MITKSQDNGDKHPSEICMLVVYEHADKICTLEGLHPTAKRLLEEDGIQLLSHERGQEFGQYACQKPTSTLINALESIGYSFFNIYEYPGAWLEEDCKDCKNCHTVHEAEAVKIVRIPKDCQSGPKLLRC